MYLEANQDLKIASITVYSAQSAPGDERAVFCQKEKTNPFVSLSQPCIRFQGRQTPELGNSRHYAISDRKRQLR